MQSFKGREKARRYAMQALYGWLIAGNDLKEIEAFYRADRNPKNYDLEYFLHLLYTIPQKIQDLEQEITPFLDRPYTSLDPIELTILRIAAYELKSRLDIPFKVVIHEAVELSIMFGAIDSHKFINKVLDKMARALRPSEILQGVAHA